MKTPDLKHIAYKGRRYRISDDGTVYIWRTLDNSYKMAWRTVTDPQLAEMIKKLEKSNVHPDNKD